MSLTNILGLVWMFAFFKNFQCDQSLSFSMPLNATVISTPSYWNGTVYSKFLEENINIKLYLNKPQGLLFYAIDNLYQSLWIEFDKSHIVFSYYNFKDEEIDDFKHDIKKLCRLSSVEDSQLNLMLTLVNNALMINCNRNEDRIFYSPNVNYVTNSTLKTFLDKMNKPVPRFPSLNSSKDGITHFWIGNTPYLDLGEYQNIAVIPQLNNFLGCVKTFTSGSSVINLVTSGSRHGNMIEKSCRPVCGSNPCHNNALCMERWRQQFVCDCGVSKFVGTLCDKSYGIEFKDDRSINVTEVYKLQNFQISFRHLRHFNLLQATKVFSIQFLFSQNLYVYMNDRGFLQIKFISQNALTIEERFQSELEHNRTYTVFISASTTGIKVKLADSHYLYIIEEKNIACSASSLITSFIYVADSHALSMKWMKRFNGCISNLMLTSGKRTFLWNQIENFDKLPSCNKKVKMVPKVTDKSLGNLTVIPPARVNLTEKVNNASIAFVAIGASIILLIIIIVIIVSFIVIRRKRNNVDKNIFSSNNQYEKTLTFDTATYQNLSVPSSPPIHFKPPYKARSISYSSNIGKSVTSLPVSVTPTLVTPEDEDC